ncbi:MAG TPA: hypothetical protein PKE69_20895 [Pyrinomonadaceae bacterium]|nr:hypothetical protein [Pyrinomonadaceae bacterium]
MSEKDLIEKVERNIKSPTISTDTGLAAAQEIGKIADAENIEWRWAAEWRCIFTVHHA